MHGMRTHFMYFDYFDWTGHDHAGRQMLWTFIILEVSMEYGSILWRAYSAFKKLRNRALQIAKSHINYEDHNSYYIIIGCFEKVNFILLFILFYYYRYR